MASILEKKFKSVFCYSLATLLLVAPGKALADGDEVQADTVHVSATRVEKELLDVPMSVSVVTKDQIEKSPASTVADLLKDVPGVQVQSSGSNGLKRVLIRGEDARRTLILIDGQKVSEQKSMDGPAILVDPSIIERIEVIRGPASVLYGSEAMGGVLNIITKKGGTKPIQGQAGVAYNGSTGGFSENLSIFGAKDGWKYRLSGSNQYHHNLQTPDGEAYHSKYKHQQMSAFLSYDFSDKFTVGASYDKFYSEIMAGSTEMRPDEFFVDMSPWERDKVAVFAEGKNLASWLPRLRFDAFWQSNHKKMLNHVNSKDATGSGPNMDNYANNHLYSLGLNLQADWQIGENNYLITGYEFHRDQLDAKSSVDMQLDVFADFPPPFNRPNVHVMDQHYTSSREFAGLQTTHAIFAQLESKLPLDFTLNVGARNTWVNSSMRKAEGWKSGSRTMTTPPFFTPNTTPIDEAEDVGQVGSEWNSRPVFNASIMWSGIDNLTLRAGWAQGFRVPGLEERFLTSSMGGGTVLPNPSLKPEFSNNFEIGARYSAHGLNFDVAAFYAIADDYISSQKVAENTSQFVNVSKAKTHGVEVSASYDLPYGFTPYTNLTYIRRELDYGNGFKTWNSGTPTWQGRAGLRTKHDLSDKVELVGDFYARFASAAKSESSSGTETRYHAWTTANASLGVNFGAEKQYSVAAEVLNIFNEKYQLNGAIYEPGVHANLKVSVKF